MKNLDMHLAAAVSFLLATASTGSAQVIVDFNSGFTLSTALNGQSASQPGLTGSYTSSTSLTPTVISGTDLTNPFALPQTGTPNQVLTGGGAGASTSVAYASLSTAFSGTTYFSYLSSTTTGGSGVGGVVGLVFNASGISATSSGTGSIQLLTVRGADIRLRPANGATNITTATLGAGTQFFVGRIDWNTSGVNETFSLWLNPDTTTNFQATTPLLSTTTTDFGTSLSSLGFIAYESNARLDNVRFGSSVAVVAVPEPSSVLLLGIGAVALILFRRNCRQTV